MQRHLKIRNCAFYWNICLRSFSRILGLTTRVTFGMTKPFRLLLSEKGPSAILTGTLAQGNGAAAAEYHPPFYYFLLNGWMKFFGNSVPAARILSIIAGIGHCTADFIYLIARSF